MVEESLKLLGVDDLNQEEKQFVLNEISNYIFDTKNTLSNEQKTFDLNLDYKYYFVDFLKFGINLNVDEISWWEFDAILEGIFLDDNSTISKVMYYRLYKKPSKNPKTQEAEEHRFRLKMQKKYALRDLRNNEQGIEKLWNYISKKAGEKKEC